MKTMSVWLTALVGITAVLTIVACNKQTSSTSNNIPPGKSQLSVYMMDDPITFDSVFVDIRQIAVEIDTASKQTDADEDDEWNDDFEGRGWDDGGDGDHHRSVIWDTLKITPGVYNLLALRNGTDTLLSSSLISTGKILKIRIWLGNDNKIFTDSTTSYPLEVFGPNPYFTINVRRTDVASVTNNELKLWLDFNLSHSIFFWNGEFLLRPNIIVFNDQMMAKLEGKVLPEGAGALVEAIMGNDTLYAIPWDEGNYQFRNVPTGTWSLTFKGDNGYQDTTITGIVVDSAQVTQVPTVTLHQ